MSTPDRKVEIAAKVTKLKTELIFAEAEAEKTAALKEHEEKLKKFKLTKELAVAKAEMDAVTTFEENELDMLLEDILLEVPDKDDLLQNYLTTQVNSACGGSLQTLLTDVKSPSELPVVEAEENSNPPYNYQVNQCQRSANPKEPAVSFSPYPTTLNPFVPAYVPALTPFPSQSETVDPLKKNIVHNGSSDFTSPKPSSGDALERLTDLLSQRRLQDSLPLLEPETFRGDLLQYPFWSKSFKTIIEDQTHKAAQRLFYLGKYTAGEAREAISGFLSLATPQAYTEAKKVLSDRFGNPFLIVDTYRKKINEWPRIQPNDGKTLRKYSDFLLHCQTAAKEIQYLKILDDPDENQKMARKLPRYLMNRWSRELDRWLNKEPKDQQQGEDGSP